MMPSTDPIATRDPLLETSNRRLSTPSEIDDVIIFEVTSKKERTDEWEIIAILDFEASCLQTAQIVDAEIWILLTLPLL